MSVVVSPVADASKAEMAMTIERTPHAPVPFLGKPSQVSTSLGCNLEFISKAFWLAYDQAVPDGVCHRLLP